MADDEDRQLSLWTSILPRGRGERTINEGRIELYAHLDEGDHCPLCGQFAKIYRRRLNSTMARGLIWLVRESLAERNWIHVSRQGPKWLVSKGGTLATIAHWGLIEAKTVEEGQTQTRCSGIWRPTPKGVDWCYGRLTVPARVHLYDGRVVGWSEEHTTIRQALGAKFDYHDLMGWTPEEAH